MQDANRSGAVGEEPAILSLYTAVNVYAAYILRSGCVLPFSIVVGVVAAPFKVLLA